MKRKHLSFSICIPVYKGSHLLKNALNSLFKQKFSDYEIIIGDDNPPELKEEIKKTQKIINSFADPRIKYFKNKKNLGYPKNLRKIVSQAKNEVLFLMAQDDILSYNALQLTHDAFFLDKNIGAVTRPYFWFETDIKKPVRAVSPPNSQKDTVFSIFEGKKAISYIFGSVGQLSGLAMRRKFITKPVGTDVFPAHIYPFASILKKHRCVFLKDYTVAVGILDSQARHVSPIYNLSPTETWIKMFKRVYTGKRFEKVRKMGIKHIAMHYTGLVQLKNFGPPGTLTKEIIIHVKYYWPSLFNLKFWFYVLVTILLPRKILLFLSDNFKRIILSKTIPQIEFKQ
ncbi:hypothetical protein COX23_05575 [Candidatus Gottesmanbacteria bacterium CG23_combo_of_CG06-09_8_20_14_all_37_19]|nr:MAG: hypothetical protein COX23_05575 [Candidatus Gottesmanbacteria bacterium CG23_combo_of_CG06-09_8_20_14_all_37_19]